MKKTILYLTACLTLCAICMTSCDEWKWDRNGDLDGMWQLTEWRDRSDNRPVAGKESGIYFCFQLDLMKLWRSERATFYLSQFTRSADSLTLGLTIEYPADTVVSPDTLRFAVPRNKRFHIDLLNAGHLQLSTDDAVLRFRKY